MRYVYRNGHLVEKHRAGPKGPLVISDIREFVTQDGVTITSRSSLRDYERKHGGVPLPVPAPPTGKKVGIIGSGPAGLAVAEELAKNGHQCTVFESWPVPGGVLLYGIPNFKMRKQILQDKLEYMERMGIQFVCNTVIGKALGSQPYDYVAPVIAELQKQINAQQKIEAVEIKEAA